MSGLGWSALIKNFSHIVPRNSKLRYVVLDFETTGLSKSDEIIEIGMVKCSGEEEVDTLSILVNPGIPLSPSITKITGISDVDLRDAPRLKDVISHVRNFIGGDVVVAYNAPFDVRFLRSAYRKYEISDEIRYIDVLPLVKALFPEMTNYKLETMIDHCSIATCQTHRALDDARCTHRLFELCLSRMQELPPDNRAILLIEKNKQPKKVDTVKLSDIKPKNDNMDPSHPMYGKTIVFTGTLSIDRRTAMQMAVDVGAVLKSNVSSNTNYLVIGSQDPDLVGEDGLSAKQERAQELNQTGKGHITIMPESEFLALIQGESMEAEEEEDLTLTADRNEQFTMPGFEVPSAKEQTVYQQIQPVLQDTVSAMGGDPAKIYFKPLTNYSSVYFDTILAFRIRIRGNSNFLEVPSSSKDTVAALIPVERQRVSGDFWRIQLDAAEMVQSAEVFAAVMRDAVNRTPKEWDCCSRYMACSDAGKCVHPDPSFALVCGYRRILESGRIFYGVNQNVSQDIFPNPQALADLAVSESDT